MPDDGAGGDYYDPCDYECNNYDPDTCNNGDNGGNNGGNDNGGNSGDIADDEVILNSQFVQTTAYCVYQAMKTGNGDLFRQTIGSFLGPDATYDLYINIGVCTNTDDACTDGKRTSDGRIEILIENTNMESLNAAATLLHEGIHAELYRYVDQVHNGEVDPNDKKRLLELYGIYKGLGWPQGHIPSQAQHVYMAENYVQPIAEAMREWDDYQYDLDYYMGFGWSGLEDHAHPSLLSSSEMIDFENKKDEVSRNTDFNPKNCN